jgi:hypothetical protein
VTAFVVILVVSRMIDDSGGAGCGFIEQPGRGFGGTRRDGASALGSIGAEYIGPRSASRRYGGLESDRMTEEGGSGLVQGLEMMFTKPIQVERIGTEDAVGVGAAVSTVGPKWLEPGIEGLLTNPLPYDAEDFRPIGFKLAHDVATESFQRRVAGDFSKICPQQIERNNPLSYKKLHANR